MQKARSSEDMTDEMFACPLVRGSKESSCLIPGSFEEIKTHLSSVHGDTKSEPIPATVLNPPWAVSK
ncbi:MAG: hypothetical protein M1587_11350 [Thaumarchaeota archaeon]|nr:hypothetical protein [Nitrososphaerota archaeon]